MSFFSRFRAAFAWGVCCAAIMLFSHARAYVAHVSFEPAAAGDAFDCSPTFGDASFVLTLTPKGPTAYYPTHARFVAEGSDPIDDMSFDPTTPGAASYTLGYDEPVEGDCTITVYCESASVLTLSFTPAAAAAAFSNDFPSFASSGFAFHLWAKDGCAFVPDLALANGSTAAFAEQDGGYRASIYTTFSSDATVEVLCSPLAAWWSDGGHIRASWTNAALQAGSSAFRHGEDVFVASGAAGQMLVKAQFPYADLTNAVGRESAAPSAGAYAVSITGLTGSDATTAPTAFAANADGSKIYAAIGSAVCRLAPTYASDAPRVITALAYDNARWTFTDEPQAIAVATTGTVDRVYVDLKHAESNGMGGYNYTYHVDALDTASGAQTEIVSGDDHPSALAATGFATGAPHLVKFVSVSDDDGATQTLTPATLASDGLSSLGNRSSFAVSGNWPADVPASACILVSDDERSAFVFGAMADGKLQVLSVEAVPAETVVRVAMPQIGVTNDVRIAYGVATNLVLSAPAGYAFLSVERNGEATELGGASTYELALDASAAQSHQSLSFSLAYAPTVEIVGPADAVDVTVDSAVEVGGTVSVTVTRQGSVSYEPVAASVDGVSAAVTYHAATSTEYGETPEYYSFSGTAVNGAKIVIALQNVSAWFAGANLGSSPSKRDSFTVAGVKPGDGRAAALDAVHGRVAFGLAATDAQGIAEFDAAKLRDAIVAEAVEPEWAENSASHDGESWGASVAAMPTFGAWISANPVKPRYVWVNPFGGAWSDGQTKANVAYYAAPSGAVPGGVADLKLSVVAGNPAGGDALYGASGTKLLKFSVAEVSGVLAFDYAASWDLAATPGAIAVVTVGGRDVVYCAPAAGGAVQVVDTAASTVADLGVSGTFSSVATCGFAAGMPQLVGVSGTTATFYALATNGTNAVSSIASATRDLKTCLGVDAAPSGVALALEDDGSYAYAACLDGSDLHVAAIAAAETTYTLRGRFFGSDGAEVGTATNVVGASGAFTQYFVAPAGWRITQIKRNGAVLSESELAAMDCTLPADSFCVTYPEGAGAFSASTYFEISVKETISIALDLLDYAWLEDGSTDVVVGETARLSFVVKAFDAEGMVVDAPENTWLSSFYVNGERFDAPLSADGTNVLTISDVQPGTRVVVASTSPRAAPENPWYAYTSRSATWTEAGFDSSLPFAQGALDATGEYFLDKVGAGAGGARLATWSTAIGGRVTSDGIWAISTANSLVGGAYLRGGAIAKMHDVALLGAADGSFMLSLPINGETPSAANAFRVTAVLPGGTATNTPTAFAFSADGLHLYGGSGNFAGVNRYRVLDGLKSANTNLVLDGHHALGAEGQSCESVALGTFTRGGAESFLYAIGKTDLKIYAVKLSDGTVADTGVSAATPYDAMAVTLTTNSTPHLTLFKGATGGANATLVVYGVSDLATGVLNATPVKSFTGAQLGKIAGHGSVDASESGPCRSLVIPDDESHAILGTLWNSSPTGLGGDVTRAQRVVFAAMSQITVRYAVQNGTFDGATDEGSVAEGEFIVAGTSTSLSFSCTDSTYTLRSATVNGETVDAVKTAAGCTLALDYTMADADGVLDLVVDFESPTVSIWTLGPVYWQYESNEKTNAFIVSEGADIFAVTENGVGVELSEFTKYDDDGAVQYVAKGYPQEGLEDDVRLVVVAREIETNKPAHAWWENPANRSQTDAPAGATQAAYHFAADGCHVAYTQNGVGRVWRRDESGLVGAGTYAVADYPHLAGAGVSEALNVALFGTTTPGRPCLSVELTSMANGSSEAPVEIANDLGLALDQFAFSHDGRTAWAICSTSSDASDLRKIHAFTVKNALKRAGTGLEFSEAWDFGSQVKFFACATNAAGNAVAYALLANGSLVATNLVTGAGAVLRESPIADGALEGSACVAHAGTANATLTVTWSSGAAHRIEVLRLAKNGVSLAESDPVASFDDDDFPYLGIASVAAYPAAWSVELGGRLWFFHGATTELDYEPKYVINFDVQGAGYACTNGVAVTSPYHVNFRSPCSELDFRGATDEHYVTAVTTNGVSLDFSELTSTHPTNWVYQGSGSDATVSVAFTPAVAATFDLVGGADMATVVPISPAETRRYRPGESVTFAVQDVKDGYALAAISLGGETVPCNIENGQFTFTFESAGAFVVAFAKTNAWWRAPAIRDVVTNAAFLGSRPLGLGYDATSGDLVFGRGDSGRTGFTHYAGAELRETIDPALLPDHQTTNKVTDVSHSEEQDVECAPYAAVSVAAGIAVGSPASTGDTATDGRGQLVCYGLSATWPDRCCIASAEGDVRTSLNGVVAMAFSDQQVGSENPVLYGYDPTAGKVRSYAYSVNPYGVVTVSLSAERDFPKSLVPFTCRTSNGRDVLYSADASKIYALDFASGAVVTNAYEYKTAGHASGGVAGVAVTGVADGVPHLMLLNAPHFETNYVDSGEAALDEDGQPVYEEVEIDDGNGGTTTTQELVTRIDVVTNWFGGVSVFALSNDCRTLVGTHPIVEPSEAGLNVLPGSTWGAFAASDDEARAFNVVSDGAGTFRLETIERQPDEYYVEGHFVDPFGATVRRDRTTTFKSGAMRVTRTFTADDRYAISAVEVDGLAVGTNADTGDPWNAERYMYDSGYVEVVEDGATNSTERVLTHYVHVKISEGFKPVVRQQLLGGVSAYTDSFDEKVVSAGTEFSAKYVADDGWTIVSCATNGVLVDLASHLEDGAVILNAGKIYSDFDVIVFARRDEAASTAKPWWENPTIVGTTSLGASDVAGVGVGPAWTSGDYAAFAPGVATSGSRAAQAFAWNDLVAGGATALRTLATNDLPFHPDAAAAFAPFNVVLYTSRTATYALALPINEEPRWTNTVDRYANAYVVSNAYNSAFGAVAFSADGQHLYAIPRSGASLEQTIVRFNVKRGLKTNGVTLTGVQTFSTSGYGYPVALAVATMPYASGSGSRDVVYYVSSIGRLFALDTNPSSSTAPVITKLFEGDLSPANEEMRIAVTGVAAGKPHLVVSSAKPASDAAAQVAVYELAKAGGYATSATAVKAFDLEGLGWIGLETPAAATEAILASDDETTLLHAAADGSVRAIRHAEPMVVDWSVRNGAFARFPGKYSGTLTNYTWESRNWEFSSTNASLFKLAFVVTNGVRMAGVPAGDTSYTFAAPAVGLDVLDVQFLPPQWFTNDNYRVIGGDAIGVVTNFTTGWIDPGSHVTGRVQVVKEGWGLVRIELGGESVPFAANGDFDLEVTDSNDFRAFFAPTNAWWRDPFRRVTVTNVLEGTSGAYMPAALDETGGRFIRSNGGKPGLTAWDLATLSDAVDPQLAAVLHDNAAANDSASAIAYATTLAAKPGEWVLTGLDATAISGGTSGAQKYPLDGSAWPAGGAFVAANVLSSAEKLVYGAEHGLYVYASKKVRPHSISGDAFQTAGDARAFEAADAVFAVATVDGKDVFYTTCGGTNLVAMLYDSGEAVTNALVLAEEPGQLVGVTVVAAGTTSPRAYLAYGSYDSSVAYRVAVVPLETNGLEVASSNPLADLPMREFFGANAGLGAFLAVQDESRAFASLTANRVAVLQKAPETTCVETHVTDENGAELVAADRSHAVTRGDPCTFRIDAPAGRLFTALVQDGVAVKSFATCSNYTYAAAAQTGFTRLSFVTRPAKNVAQTFVGPLTASPAEAAWRVADGESFRATYKPATGYYVASISTNGALYAFTATQGAAVTLDTGALGADVRVTVVAARIRKNAEHKWWENPVVVHVHEPAYKASGAYRMGGDGDFVAAGGRPGEPASVLDVSTVEDDDGGFTVVTNLPSGGDLGGAGVSAAINRALFGHRSGSTSLAVPLVGERETFAIANSEAVKPLQWAFSADASKAYAPCWNGAKPNSYVHRFNVLGGLTADGTRLASSQTIDGFKQSVWSIAYASVSIRELLFAALDDGSVAVKEATDFEGDATPLLAAGKAKLSLTNASLSVCCADKSPHLAIAESVGTNTALEVFALGYDGLTANADPVLSLDGEHLMAMGIAEATNTFAASVYGLAGGSAAILGWGGNFYAVKYVAPIEVTYGVTNGACDRAEDETFLVKSWFTDDEKRFTFTADSGNILKKATVNGVSVPFTYGASSFSYVPGNDATQHVEVVFLPPECLPEPVDATYVGRNADNRYCFTVPTTEGTTVTVYSNGVPLVKGERWWQDGATVTVKPFGKLSADVHLVVAATEPRAAVAKRWYEAPMAFGSYVLNKKTPSCLGDEEAMDETGANWGFAATQDYFVDVAGAGRGGATLYRYAEVEEKKASAIWQLAYSDELFGGGPLGAAAASKPLNVALLGTTNGEYMVSLPLALAKGEVLDDANVFRITAVAADGVSPTNTPAQFAFSSDGTKLYGVAPYFTGVNEYEVVGGLKESGAKLKFVRNHPFRDGENALRTGASFAYLETWNEAMSRTDLMAFARCPTGALYRVSLHGDNVNVRYETVSLPGTNVQLAVAGVAATNVHLYAFTPADENTYQSRVMLRIFAIGQPGQSYALSNLSSYTALQVAGWTGTSSSSFRAGGFCAMAVPDDERSFTFAANAYKDDRAQARYLVRTVPDWPIRWEVVNGACASDGKGSASSLQAGLDTVTKGEVTLKFTCTKDYYLDAYSVDEVAQPVSIVPPIRSLEVPVSEYNGLSHHVYVHFEKRIVNLQLIGGLTAVEQSDRSYYVTLPGGNAWTLIENGVAVPAERATNLTDNASVIHYTPDEEVAVLNAVFTYEEPREEIAEADRWYAPGSTALKWSHQPTAAGYLGRYEQRQFAGVNWATDANGGSYLLDVAGWRQGGASLYAMADLETGKVERVGGKAGAVWQVAYDTQLLAGNSYKYAEFNGGAVSKALGVAAIAVHDGSILPTNVEVMLSMPLDLRRTTLNDRSVFRITAYQDDADKTYAKTPRSGAFTADGRHLWGVSDGFAGVRKYEVQGGLKSSGQGLKLVDEIPLRISDEDESQPSASMAYAVICGKEVAFALGTNCVVYAVNLTDRTVWEAGTTAGSWHDQLAIAGVGLGIPHLYLARAAVTNLAETGNALLKLYNVDTNKLFDADAATKPLLSTPYKSYTPEQVADWCGFTTVEKSWSYYTCAIAVPDNEKSLVMTWNFPGAPYQRRYVVQKRAASLLSLSGVGVASLKVATTANGETSEPTDAANVTSVRPYARVRITGGTASSEATSSITMMRLAGTLTRGDPTRVTETNGVWTIGDDAAIEVSPVDCADSAGTTAADITNAVLSSASAAELTDAQKSAVSSNVEDAVALAGGQQTAQWLEDRGWGATLSAADVAAAKDMDLSVLLGTEVLLATGVVATITAAAETEDANGDPQLAFTFQVEDGAGNGALDLAAGVVGVVKNFVRKSASLDDDASWEAPEASDLDVTLSEDRKSATVTVKMGDDGEASQGFYKLLLK